MSVCVRVCECECVFECVCERESVVCERVCVYTEDNASRRTGFT